MISTLLIAAASKDPGDVAVSFLIKLGIVMGLLAAAGSILGLYLGPKIKQWRNKYIAFMTEDPPAKNKNRPGRKPTPKPGSEA